MVVVGGLRNDMLPVFSSSWIIGDILMDGTPQAKYWGPGLWSPPPWINSNDYCSWCHLIVITECNERIEYKLLSLTYKVLTTSQPDYLYNLISVQSTGRTRSSCLVTLARPPVSSSLQITNRSFTYASPYLWNQLPPSFHQPHFVHCPPGSPHPAHITSSQSPPLLSSPIIT